MKQILFLATIFGATCIGVYALDLPAHARTQTQNQQKQGQGQMKGKRGGPQDGSGPIHPPGTGGGQGQGQRKGGGRK